MRNTYPLALGLVTLLATGCQTSTCTPVVPVYIPAATGAALQKPSECLEQKYHHRYGVQIEPDQWYQSGCSGKVVTSLRDGITISQTFANGMLNGEATYTYPNSTLLEKREVYDNDCLTSETRYRDNGTPICSKEYSTPEIWTETSWYESGQPKSIEKYERGLLLTGDYFTLDNQRDAWVYAGNGERIRRDDQGTFEALDEFRGGELALTTTRHPNGSTHEIISYANGKIHGEKKSYYPGGEPMAIETWVDGEKTGITQIFQNGEKYAEVPYVNGKKNGVERKFRDGSEPSQEITWLDDQMHGPMYTYVGDGVQTDWFYRGRLTSRTNFESFALPRRPMTPN